MAAIKLARVRLDELQNYICPSVPFCIPALTVKNVWKLRVIEHEASQEMLGQSDGPLGSHCSSVLGVELTEGDHSDPAVVRPLGQPRSPSLIMYFYDEWAVAAQHLVRGDVLEVIAPSQALAALPSTQRGDRPYALCLAPLQPFAASGLLQGLTRSEQEKAAGNCRVRVFRRAVTLSAAFGEAEEQGQRQDMGPGGGPAPLAPPHKLVQVATLTIGSRVQRAEANAMVASAVPLPPEPQAARVAKRRVDEQTIESVSSSSSSSSSTVAAPAIQPSTFNPTAVPALRPASSTAKKSSEGYEYLSLAALQREASSMTKKRFSTWAVVLRAGRLTPCKAGHDHFITVDIADQSMHPGASRSSSSNAAHATLVLFCDPVTHGATLSNMILAPGVLIRLHRVSVKLWEGRLQLSGNVSKRLSGGVTAALVLHPLSPPSSLDTIAAVTAPPPRVEVVLQGPILKRTRLDSVIDASKSGGSRRKGAAAAAAAGARGAGHAATAADVHDDIVDDDEEEVVVPPGPWVAWSQPLLKDAGLQVLRTEVQSTGEETRSARPPPVPQEKSNEDEEDRIVLAMKTSHTATKVNLNDPQLERLFRFSFSLLSSIARLPPLGASYERWARLAEVPNLLDFGNPNPSNQATAGQTSFQPFERMKLDVVALVLAVHIAYEDDFQDGDAERARSISSVTLVLWDGSGVSHHGVPRPMLGLSSTECMVAKRSYAIARMICDVAEGWLSHRVGPPTLQQQESPDDAPAGASAYRPASEALRLTYAALSTAATNRCAARAQGGTARPKPNADARERTVLLAMADRFQMHAAGFGAFGTRTEVKLDLTSLISLTKGIIGAGISSHDAASLQSLAGKWLRVSSLARAHPRGNNSGSSSSSSSSSSMNGASTSSSFELVLDAESVLEVMPLHAAEIRLLLREYALSTANNANVTTRHPSPAVPAGTGAAPPLLAAVPGAAPGTGATVPLVQPPATTAVAAAASTGSRRTHGRSGGELWCLAEVLATPVPEAEVWVVATLQGYYPNTDADSSDYPLAQQEPRVLPHGGGGGAGGGATYSPILPGAWRWVLALTLEDDTAKLSAMVAPAAAASLVGVCAATHEDEALPGQADYDGEGAGVEADRGAGRYPSLAARRARQRLENLKGAKVECGIALELFKEPATGLLRLTPFITAVHVL